MMWVTATRGMSAVTSCGMLGNFPAPGDWPPVSAVDLYLSENLLRILFLTLEEKGKAEDVFSKC